MSNSTRTSAIASRHSWRRASMPAPISRINNCRERCRSPMLSSIRPGRVDIRHRAAHHRYVDHRRPAQRLHRRCTIRRLQPCDAPVSEPGRQQRQPELDSTQSDYDYDYDYDYEAYFKTHFFVVLTIKLMTGLKSFRNDRQYVDHGGLSADPAYTSARAVYNGLDPKFGLLWQPARDIQAFVDITCSQDVPDFGDLTQTFSATTCFTPIRWQHAWTLGAGTRGHADRLAWDLTTYRSLVRDQLLRVRRDALRLLSGKSAAPLQFACGDFCEAWRCHPIKGTAPGRSCMPSLTRCIHAARKCPQRGRMHQIYANSTPLSTDCIDQSVRQLNYLN